MNDIDFDLILKDLDDVSDILTLDERIFTEEQLKMVNTIVVYALKKYHEKLIAILEPQ